MNAKADRLLRATRRIASGAVVVEIGCVRRGHEVASDGWSTIYLGRRALRRGWCFFSVDCDPDAVALGREAVGDLPVRFVCSDGATFLRALTGRVDCLYLDGEADPEQASSQYEAATLSQRASVLVDDAQAIGAHLYGKASQLLDRLARDGFRCRLFDTEPGYRMLVAHR